MLASSIIWSLDVHSKCGVFVKDVSAGGGRGGGDSAEYGYTAPTEHKVYTWPVPTRDFLKLQLACGYYAIAASQTTGQICWPLYIYMIVQWNLV